MTRLRQVFLLLGIALAGGLVPLAPAAAENYPTRPIRILVGFGAGSTADVLIRIVGQSLSKTLGQQIVVENRPGAGSMLAAEAVSRAPNDGYMLFTATVANTISPAITAGSSFNLGKDLAPVALLGVIPNVLVANPAIKATTLQQLIALAKAKPDDLFFAAAGSGTAGHLSAELFNGRAGTKVVVVQYQGGSAQAVSDLLTGRVNLMFAVASTMLPHIQEGKLRALAVAQAKRTASLPDVPTMSEAGMPDFDASIWVGLLAPPGTPKEIVDQLARAVNDALKSEDVLGPMRAQGFDPLGGSPAEFARFIQTDIDRWNSVANSAGLRK
jgi:tripartite-type tricarboxylate transporter receptor subunit TctC